MMRVRGVAPAKPVFWESDGMSSVAGLAPSKFREIAGGKSGLESGTGHPTGY